MISLNLREKSNDVITNIPDDWRLAGQRGWWSFGDLFPGAWQRSIPIDRESVLSYSTVWACITLIAADIGKLWINLVEKDLANDICTPTTNTSYTPVLEKPNHYQTRVKFFENWAISRLVYGNTYVLKERNHRGGPNAGNVTALYVLDPTRVQVLVSADGSVFYQLAADNLAGIPESVTVPATEIIHDVCVPLHHPLCGVSPIYACGLAAMQGLKIQNNTTKLFANGSQISGVLSAPGSISQLVADRIQKHWEENYTGEKNIGKVAVLGDGLKFEAMTMTAVDAQLIDQLKWGAEQICATFHVPGYMVGIGAAPPYTDIQSINLQYYSQALQNPVENMELLLEEGLEIDRKKYGIEFDIDALARMDTKTQMAIAKDGVAAGIFSPNNGRAKFNLKPVAGGETPYLQQQNYSLAALAKRDASADPFQSSNPKQLPPTEPKGIALDQVKAFADRFCASVLGVIPVTLAEATT